VRRLIEEYEALPDHVRQEQALFRWPASMESGALPWAASQAALELLRHCDEQGLSLPTNREAKWFWRLRLAAPLRERGALHQDARLLSMAEHGQPSGSLESIQWDLAYDGDEAARRTASYRARNPRPVSRAWSGADGEEAQRYLESTLGPGAWAEIQRRLADRHGQAASDK
jgi:hypothetical protein